MRRKVTGADVAVARWTPLIAAWAVAAVIASALFYAGAVAERVRPRPFLPTLAIEAVGWGFWLVWAPFIAYISRRFPVRRHGLLLGIAVHSVVATLLVSAHLGLLVIEDFATGLGSIHNGQEAMRTWLRVLAYRSPPDFFIYASLVVSLQLMAARRLLNARELAEARLKADLSEARLRALRAQIHPHFLFNTLNSAVTLVRDVQTDQAQQLLVDLAALLRAELDDWDAPEHTVGDEIRLVERYLAIERARFDTRLHFSLAVPSDCLVCVVPRFVLQPLVENALRHAVESREHGGTIAVGARREHGQLLLWVEDNGPGLPEQWSDERRPGTGLRNVSARLAELYGDEGHLVLTDASAIGGVTATITLPDRSAATTAVQ